MKYIKSLIFICLIISLFSIASVCASDVNQTVAADVETNPEIDLGNADKLTASPDEDSLKSSSDESDASVLKDNKKGTVIVVSDLTTDYRSGEYLYVTLTDDENKPLSSEVLSVSMNGENNNRVTGADGKINMSTYDLNVGTYDVHINYDGDNNYAESSADIKIIVNKADSFLDTVDSYSLNYGNTAEFTVGVFGATGITAKIGNLNLETDGLTIKIPKLSAGTHKLVITTIPKDNFNSVSKTTTLTVSKDEASFKLHDLAMDYGVSFGVIVSSGGATGFVAKIDGKDVSAKDGTISISGLNAGNHTFTVTSIPDENHTSVTKEVTITIKKIDSAISVKDLSIEYVSPISITLFHSGATGFTAKVDGESVDVIDDTIKIPKLDAGSYTLSVTTIPDENHNPITKAVTITVNKVNPQFDIEDVTLEYGGHYNKTLSSDGNIKFTAKIDGKNIDIKNRLLVFPKLEVGTHDLTVSTVEDTNHNSVTKTAKITIYKAKTSMVTHNLETTVGLKTNLTAGMGSVEAIDEGVITFYNGKTKLGQAKVNNGLALLVYTPSKVGVYTISAVYDGTSRFESSSSTFILTVSEKSNSSSSEGSNPSTGNDSSKINSSDIQGDTMIIVPYSDANITMEVKLSSDATGNVTLLINGESYVFPVENGVAKITVPELEDGKYPYTLIYSGDSKYPSTSRNGTINKEITKVDPKIVASNVNAVYSAGSVYTIKVYGTDGKPADGATVKITGKISKTLKATDGVAKFKLTQLPGTYKITITSMGKSVTKTITVKHVVTLKAVTVKKSAKKLVLQANLAKVNGKYLNKKTVTFKFNGKTYKAKTNSKGVAKVTIKSSVLKKLKVGKKITYQATYLKDTVKKSVKVKK